MEQLAPLENNFIQVPRYNITQEDWKPFRYQQFHIKSGRDLLERVMLHGSTEWYVVRGNGWNPKKSTKRNIIFI